LGNFNELKLTAVVGSKWKHHKIWKK